MAGSVVVWTGKRMMAGRWDLEVPEETSGRRRSLSSLSLDRMGRTAEEDCFTSRPIPGRKGASAPSGSGFHGNDDYVEA